MTPVEVWTVPVAFARKAVTTAVKVPASEAAGRTAQRAVSDVCARQNEQTGVSMAVATDAAISGRTNVLISAMSERTRGMIP